MSYNATLTTFYRLDVVTNAGMAIPSDIATRLDTIKALDVVSTPPTDVELLDTLPRPTPANVGKVLNQLTLALGARPHYGAAVETMRNRLADEISIYMQIAAPAWLEALRDRFQPLAAIVHSYAPDFEEGLPPLHSSDAPETGQQYAELRGACQQLDQLRQVRQVISHLEGTGDVDESFFIEPPASLELYQRARSAWQRQSIGSVWHAIVYRGLALRLNTAEEASQVRAKAEQGDAARSQQALHQRRLANVDPGAAKMHDAYVKAATGNRVEQDVPA